MRWTPGGSSSNVEDRRGGGGGGGFRMGGGGMGIGGTVIVLILSLIFGRNLFNTGSVDTGPATTADGTSGAASGDVAPAVSETATEKERREFMTFVLNDANGMWTQTLPKYGNQYRDARLVLFRDAVQSGCGNAESAMGPFYCPRDQRVYLDLGFYDELQRRFGAPGDFAEAYVLAHEIGHHVQNMVGTSAQVQQRMESRPSEANALSVRLELQADCFAGVWGNTARSRNLLDPGDVEEGLAAASAVGDDRLQKQATGQVHPESFTHGTSAQRMTWFRRGFDSGDMRNCDTFAGAI